MKYRTINEAQAFADWSDAIVESADLSKENPRDNEKIQWMSTMMAITERVDRESTFNPKNLLESGYGSQAPGELTGMGPVTYPSDPGTGVGATDGAFFQPTYQRGSGDIPSAKLAVAMNVAAYTIGLELLPVIPMEFPSMMYSYLDHVYGTGTVEGTTLPPYIRLGGGDIGTSDFDYSPYTKGDYVYITQADLTPGPAAYVADTPALQLKYVTKHRITGELIVEVVAAGTIDASGNFTADTTSSVSAVITSAFNGASDTWVIVGGTVSATGAVGTAVDLGGAPEADLLSAMDEHIEEFSNPAGEITADGPSRFSATRDQGEDGTENSINLRLYSTSVEAGTVEVIANITKTQLKDLGAYGIDAMEQIYKAAQNELTQTINKDILRTMFRLGVTAHASLKQAQGLDLNLFVGPSGTANKDLANFGIKEFVDILGNDRSGDFTAVVNGETNSSAENYATRQRRIASHILAAKNVISNVGRHGAGDFSVVNTQLASALQDVRMLRDNPFDNSITVNTRNLYYIGDLNGTSVYCDPNMDWNDTRILVGRKGTEDDPGLKFFAYQLAESIETISETSMSPKIAVTSRYALVPAGFYPEAQYLTVACDTGFGKWI